jgi:hypothetical protein
MTLGILVSNIKKRGRSLPYGGQRRVIRELKKEGEKRGIKVKVFTPRKKIFDVDLIFDRYFSKNKTHRELSKEFRKRAQKNKIPIFNDYRFINLVNNKWRFYQLLKKERKFKKYLQKTFLYKDINNLNKFLIKEDELFLKPKYGQKGGGIITVKKENADYLIKYQAKANDDFNCEPRRRRGEKMRQIPIIEKRSRSLDALEKIIKKNWEDKPYILQPKIDVAEYKNRVFDLRILVQNQGKKWQVTGIGARLAQKGSFLTNIHAGGEEISGGAFVLFLKKVFGGKSDRILKKVKKISIDLAKYLEKKLKVTIVEMGIDLVLDKKNKIWIIEINSKPGRIIYLKRGKKRLMKKTIIPLLLFAKFLSRHKIGARF